MPSIPPGEQDCCSFLTTGLRAAFGLGQLAVAHTPSVATRASGRVPA